MKQYNVTGMSCAACQARVEKAVSKVEGVTACAVSLLTNSMGVEGSADPAAVIKAVEDAGYGASVKGESASVASQEDALTDRETPRLARRLVASLVFLAVLMYFSMGNMMFGWPVPAFFEHDHIALGLLQMILSGAVLIINQKFFISGFKSMMHLAPNMDTLIAMGSAVAYGYSVVILFLMTKAKGVTGLTGSAASDALSGSAAAVPDAMALMDELYFESAAMILTLITVGKMLEAYSKGKTTNALKSLLSLAPRTANVVRDGAEMTVPIDDVTIGEVFVVRPGENIPVDGVITEGSCAVNESALTGEGIPVDKATGDEVSSGTQNMSGFITCKASRVGEDTTLSQIIAMVSDAAATKAPVAKLADQISGIFVPVVIAIAFITIVIWLAVGADAGYALARGITVLVVSCPCALGLATPVAIMVGNGVGAKNGILFKNAEALQETGRIDIVALDKTGTITKGEPEVCDVIAVDGVEVKELLMAAYSLEKKSEHPLAKAVVKYVEGAGPGSGSESGALPGEAGAAVREYDVQDFSVVAGNGLSGRIGDDSMLYGGNAAYIESIGVKLGDDETRLVDRVASEGRTPMLFAIGSAAGCAGGVASVPGCGARFLGIISVADTIREDSAKAIAAFKNMGIKTVMLTGDYERTARVIADQAGVDDVVAGVRPDGKDEVIRSLQKDGKVAMIGDGINDAPALTRADIGIAIGAGTDVAIDAADVVLMKSRLSDAVAAVRLSRRTYVNIKENLFWALFYNVLLIPTAAGAYVHLFGLTMNPMLGAAAMSLSSFCVVTNALRLNMIDINDDRHDRPKRSRNTALTKETGTGTVADNTDGVKKEDGKMQKTMTIEGMMCEHCEARVKKVLEAIDGVESAVVSHEKGTAVVELRADVSDEVLTEAVKAQDYEVKGVA